MHPPPRLSRWTCIAVCIAAFVAPIALAILLSRGPFGGRVVPEWVPGSTPSDLAIQVVSDVCSMMVSMAIGIAVTMGWLYRQPIRRSLGHTPAVLLSLGLVLAFVSIYSGLKFKYDMAMQIAVVHFNFDMLRSRILWQGCTLILEVSTLCVSGVLHYLFRVESDAEL